MRKSPDDLSFYGTVSKSRSLRSLFTIALGIAILGSGYTQYLIRERERKNKESPIYKEALEKLSKYPPTAEYVGVPIRTARLKSCEISHHSFQMIVRVKGDNGKANLIIHATRSQMEQPKLSELELEVLHTNPTFKWTFYKLKDENQTREDLVNAAKSTPCRSSPVVPSLV